MLSSLMGPRSGVSAGVNGGQCGAIGANPSPTRAEELPFNIICYNFQHNAEPRSCQVAAASQQQGHLIHIPSKLAIGSTPSPHALPLAPSSALQLVRSSESKAQ